METKDYENREFMILNMSELGQIDFTQVVETSEETVRQSIDGTKTFIKWDGTIPLCVEGLTTKEGPYNYDEILLILSTPEWTSNEPIKWEQ